MDDNTDFEAVVNKTENNERNNESDDDQERNICHVERKDALDIALRYVEQQPISTSVDVLNLKRWMDYAVDKCKSNVKQKENDKLSSYI